MDWVAFVAAVAVGYCVYRVVMWAWSTYELGKAVEDGSRSNQ